MIFLSFLFALISARNKHFEFKNVKLRPEVGYYAFNYEGAGIQVKDAFYFHSDRPTVLTVLDCFCTGDVFNVYDNGIFLGTTVGAQDQDTTCFYFSSDPNYCLFVHNIVTSPPAAQWSQFGAALNPGTHNITIVPRRSPYGKGTAFLRLDYWCEPQPESKQVGVDLEVAPIFPNGLTPCCVFENSCNVNTFN